MFNQEKESKDIIDVKAEGTGSGPDDTDCALEQRPPPEAKTLITTPQSLTPELTRGFEIQAAERKRGIEEFNKFVKEELVEGQDYGIVPGIKKPFLWKGGAEKICSYRALFPHYTIIEKTRDFEDGFFDYWTKCTLYKVVFFEGKAIEVQVGEGEGTCNSNETKYRFRWEFRSNVPEDIDINSLQSKKVKSKAGREFTMYKIVNSDPCSLDNTIRKMSNKRAYLAATLTSTPGASVIFTQDLEDKDQDKKTAKKKPEQKQKKEYAAKQQDPSPNHEEGDPNPEPGKTEEGLPDMSETERPDLYAKIKHLKEKVGEDMYAEAKGVLFGEKTKFTVEELKLLIKQLEQIDFLIMQKKGLPKQEERIPE